MIYLDEKQIKIVKEILKKNVPSRKIVVFGSRAKGAIKPFSDLDLCIMGDEPLSFEKLGNLREDFSNSDLPIKVDIVEWASITSEFREIVKADCETIQEKNDS